jgi:hypothetical protein
MHIEFKTDRREVIDYSIVLLVEVDGELETVRLYDGAHGENDTRKGGKQPAEMIHHGSLGSGMRAARCSPSWLRISARTGQERRSLLASETPARIVTACANRKDPLVWTTQ